MNHIKSTETQEYGKNHGGVLIIVKIFVCSTLIKIGYIFPPSPNPKGLIRRTSQKQKEIALNATRYVMSCCMLYKSHGYYSCK
jgi:hypothetical protein